MSAKALNGRCAGQERGVGRVTPCPTPSSPSWGAGGIHSHWLCHLAFQGYAVLAAAHGHRGRSAGRSDLGRVTEHTLESHLERGKVALHDLHTRGR